MNKIMLGNELGSPKSILCLGAHCDDIEIGCGGTILRLVSQFPDLEIRWIVFSSTPEREPEALKAADAFLANVRKRKITVNKFRDGFFPSEFGKAKEFFEELKKEVSPDIIFTHYRNDRHQDHRVISDLTWNTWRDHLILEYEVPKYDGDFGSPNFFVHLDKDLLDKKVKILKECYGSQRSRQWFSEETFRGVARLRGMESNAKDQYAEGFYCRKVAF